MRKSYKNTVYQCIHMEFRKMVMITLYARQQKRHRCIEQSLDSVGEGFRMGTTCTPVVDSCRCMAKPIQYCKLKNK